MRPPPPGRGLTLPFRSSKKNNHPTDSEKSNRSFSVDPPERTPLKATMDIFTSKEKRRSLALPGRSSSPAHGSPKASPRMAATKPAKVVIDMESPPLVFFGTPAQSSGALLSGQLLLTVTEPEAVLQSFDMDLLVQITTKKPVSKDCPDCASRTNTLFHWKFLTEPNHFKKGTHPFPFSYLLPGNLPATSHAELGAVDYILRGTARTTIPETIDFTRNLIVQRALIPGMDRNHIRVFPPTNLTATVVLPSQIYPIGEFPVQLRMTGIIDYSLKDIQRRWRIRRLNWHIDESSRMVSAACAKHAHKVGGEGKGVLHDEIRTIGKDDLKTGWKTDFDTEGGQIDLEFTASINPDSRPVCAVDSPTGLSTSHNLVLEIIVSEEQTSGKGSKYAAPTGGARILRMQFKLVVTERSGMGVSWDEENPPVYEDVPESPPGYHRMEEFEGSLGELGEEEVELERLGR